MDNYFNTSQTFDSEPWLSVSEPIVKNDFDINSVDNERSVNTSADNSMPKRKRLTAPVLTFQLIISMLILLFSFVAKTFMSEMFSEIKFMYDKEINASMYFSGDFSDLDYSEFFGASQDEV